MAETTKTTQSYSFGAGPAMLPPSVMDRARREWQQSPNGFSLFEVSHRSPQVEELYRNTRATLCRLLRVPPSYEVLFMQGGGTGQFSAVPLNFTLPSNETDTQALYCVSGSWSAAAACEARKFTRVQVADTVTQRTHDNAKSQKSLKSLSESLTKRDFSSTSYLYYCDNETIDGLEFDRRVVDSIDQVPIVSDMSSNFLSREFNVSKYACVFAAAQKNLGASGLTVALVRQDMLHFQRRRREDIPKVLDYRSFADPSCKGMPHTPCTYSVYLAGLVLEWIESEFGGLDRVEEHNRRKAELLYSAIDDMPDKFFSPVYRDSRSRMNIVFRVLDPATGQPSPAEEQEFLRNAEAVGLHHLQGHRSVGGIRASLYNAMPLEGVERLVQFMQEF